MIRTYAPLALILGGLALYGLALVLSMSGVWRAGFPASTYVAFLSGLPALGLAWMYVRSWTQGQADSKH